MTDYQEEGCSRGRVSASEITYIVSGGALNSTHSLQSTDAATG